MTRSLTGFLGKPDAAACCFVDSELAERSGMRLGSVNSDRLTKAAD